MIKLVITDLDDTLYSWIGFFIPSFYAMVQEVSKLLDVSENQLIKEYKEVHQQVGSVEFPHATLRLPSVQKKYASLTKEQQLECLDSAFHRFNSMRKKLLVLYPGVQDALEFLVKQEINLVGYTESAEENGFYRLKKLKIDNCFKRVYVSSSQYQRPEQYPHSPKTIIVHGKKPNPNLIEEICKKEAVSPLETLYIGDSLSKDMLMAKQAGVHSIWVNIPVDDPELYNKLVAISHWTEKDFLDDNRNKRQWREAGYFPDFTIHSFTELPKIIQSL